MPGLKTMETGALPVTGEMEAKNMEYLQKRDYSVQGNSVSGTIYTFKIRVTENSVNDQQNTSNLTVEAILLHNRQIVTFAQWGTGVSCTLNGNKIFSDYQQRKCEPGENVYYTWTGNVEHNSDGSLKLKVGGELWQNSSANYTPPRMTIAENEDTAMDLKLIAKESTAVASDAYIGSNTTISVNRGNQNHTHSILLEFGEISGYIGNDWNFVKEEVKLSATSIGFKIPEDFYEQIPNEDSEECTLIITTYSGEVQVGDPKESTFRVMANPAVCSPVVKGTVEDVNDKTVKLTGNKNRLVKFFSKALCTIEASGKYSATIRDVQIDNTVLDAGDNTLEIDKVETTSIVFAAIDSRGFRGSHTENVDLVNYIQLTNQATCKRTDPTSGNAKLTFAGDWFNDSFGAESNSLTLQYQIDDGAVVDVPYSPDNTDRYAAEVMLTGLDYTQRYTITVTVKDKLDTEEKVLVVQKGIPVFDWGENDFAFHVPVTVPQVNGVCSIASKYIRGWDIYLRKNLKSWEDDGDNTQSILLFGGSVYGLITADDRGGILWNGTSNVSVIDDSAGVLKITLPFYATYNFVAISTDPITFL